MMHVVGDEDGHDSGAAFADERLRPKKSEGLATSGRPVHRLEMSAGYTSNTRLCSLSWHGDKIVVDVGGCRGGDSVV